MSEAGDAVHDLPGGRATGDAAALRQALRATLAAAVPDRPLLVALDFDGTLAPLQNDPAASRIIPAGVELLARLHTDPALVLALVSGRALADLHVLAQVPVGTRLVGSHGAERGRTAPGGLERDEVRLDDAQRALLAELAARAAAIATEHAGVWVETKPTSVVVHTRPADPDVAARAEERAVAMGEQTGAHVLHGKAVVELAVQEAGKGQALAALRAETGARTVLYAGDDVTDERAFAALGADDVTVKVGTGPTLARFRVNDPQALVATLEAGLHPVR